MDQIIQFFLEGKSPTLKKGSLFVVWGGGGGRGGAGVISVMKYSIPNSNTRCNISNTEIRTSMENTGIK